VVVAVLPNVVSALVIVPRLYGNVRTAELPEGEDVIGQFPVQEIAPIDIEDETDDGDDDLQDPDVAAVPDFNSELAGIDQFKLGSN